MKKQVDNLPAYLFHQGTNYKAYEYMGANRSADGYIFRVWAPDADAVYLVGDFNLWDRSMPMERITDGGIWEICDRDGRVRCGALYKFCIVRDGAEVYRGDPYARVWQIEGEVASVVAIDTEYQWGDTGWLACRRDSVTNVGYYSLPMNVYELHLGSWRRRDDHTYMSYSELACEISTYVKQMGYTHVLLMSIMEYQNDAEMGHETVGYFAPTSRYGSPEDFCAFVDKMHEAGVGVILDLPIAHFPKDRHGLFEFDGKPLYERVSRVAGGELGIRRSFDLARSEVESFLVSVVSYWVEQFHADGFRIGGVETLLHSNEGESRGEWQSDGGSAECDPIALTFFRKLNTHVKNLYPDVLMIAEESGTSVAITSFESEGLGFDLKLNTGWARDTLDYVRRDPIYRKYHHEDITFSLTYAFGEKYMLPLSCDTAGVTKGALAAGLPAVAGGALDGMRLLAAYMMTHPGKKLSFMGMETGQREAWRPDGELDWSLLDNEANSRLQLYLLELNHFYLRNPALWQNDRDWGGFSWIDADNREHSVFSYRRIGRDGGELVVVLNFTPVRRDDYLVGVCRGGAYEEVFNSDDKRYGGSGATNRSDLYATSKPWNSQPFSLRLTIPPMGVTILRPLK